MPSYTTQLQRPSYTNTPRTLASRAKYLHRSPAGNRYTSPISWIRSVHEQALRTKSAKIGQFNAAQAALERASHPTPTATRKIDKAAVAAQQPTAAEIMHLQKIAEIRRHLAEDTAREAIAASNMATAFDSSPFSPSGTFTIDGTFDFNFKYEYTRPRTIGYKPYNLRPRTSRNDL